MKYQAAYETAIKCSSLSCVVRTSTPTFHGCLLQRFEYQSVRDEIVEHTVPMVPDSIGEGDEDDFTSRAPKEYEVANELMDR